MIDITNISSDVPKELITILKELSDDNYILLCHSSKAEQVKSWNLPYKIMNNAWTDNTFIDTNKIYVIPDYKNKPIKYCWK